MKNQIDNSNQLAAINRNKYPIQEQATQMDLWEYVPCTCERQCSCKKFGCENHWKLKRGVQFDDFVRGFLRMFVDRCEHLNILDVLENGDSSRLIDRIKESYFVLQSLKKDWKQVSSQAAGHNKTLFCDDWFEEKFKDDWSFSVDGTVYEVKKYHILFPDICVPYDTKSRIKILKHCALRSPNYDEFLEVLRLNFMNCMEENHINLPDLRSLDSPEKYLPFNTSLISLPRPGTNYGSSYSPKTRQIGLVLDKCFYSPRSSA